MSGRAILNASDAPQPGSPFVKPWHARLFALTVAMNEAGHVEWSEWAALLGRHLLRAQDGDDDYWRAWAAALEEMLENQGIADASTVAALTQAWQAAAHATPHGQPILLENADG